jgi:hypothetical protein
LLDFLSLLMNWLIEPVISKMNKIFLPSVFFFLLNLY